MKPYHRVLPVPIADAYRFETGSIAVFGSSCEYFWEGRTALTIKLYQVGSALYETHDGLHRVESGYLILNEDCHYRATLKSETPVQFYSLFFARQFVEDVAGAMHLGVDEQLESPISPPASSRRFFERIGRNDGLHERMTSFGSQFARWHSDPLWLSEQYYQIAEGMVEQCDDTWREVESIQASRPSTREEVFRRLWKARDWVHAMLDTDVTLADMADVACMSESYFLRTFKKTFKQTPHQFLIDLRLEKARSLLRGTSLSITEITAAVGFQSLGSFSWLFKQRHGMSPEAFRLSRELGDLR